LRDYGSNFKHLEIGNPTEEEVLFNRGPRTCSLLAVTDLEFVTIDKNTFWRI